jgi:hypothetical protein
LLLYQSYSLTIQWGLAPPKDFGLSLFFGFEFYALYEMFDGLANHI